MTGFTGRQRGATVRALLAGYPPRRADPEGSGDEGAVRGPVPWWVRDQARRHPLLAPGGPRTRPCSLAAHAGSWIRIPRLDHTPSERLRFVLSGGRPHRASECAGTPSRSLEDQLAEIVQEITLRGEAAERRRLDEIEAARQKRVRWEAASARRGRRDGRAIGRDTAPTTTHQAASPQARKAHRAAGTPPPGRPPRPRPSSTPPAPPTHAMPA